MSNELGVLDSRVENPTLNWTKLGFEAFNPPLTTKAIKTGWILSGLVGAPGLCEFLEIHTIYNQLYVSYVAREQDLNFHFEVKQAISQFHGLPPIQVRDCILKRDGNTRKVGNKTRKMRQWLTYMSSMRT